jgi:hypothetical protein
MWLRGFVDTNQELELYISVPPMIEKVKINLNTIVVSSTEADLSFNAMNDIVTC